MYRGGRGPGGPPSKRPRPAAYGRHGGRSGGRGGATPKSFFKRSMVEDPWRSLVVSLCERKDLDPAELEMDVVVKLR